MEVVGNCHLLMASTGAHFAKFDCAGEGVVTANLRSNQKSSGRCVNIATVARPVAFTVISRPSPLRDAPPYQVPFMKLLLMTFVERLQFAAVGKCSDEQQFQHIAAGSEARGIGSVGVPAEVRRLASW